MSGLFGLSAFMILKPFFPRSLTRTFSWIVHPVLVCFRSKNFCFVFIINDCLWSLVFVNTQVLSDVWIKTVCFSSSFILNRSSFSNNCSISVLYFLNNVFVNKKAHSLKKLYLPVNGVQLFITSYINTTSY